eukprot:1821302-Pleurochrysis_carterae.AAC.1
MGWTMYRYKKDAVQPEGGKRGYINAAEAVEQRERWRVDELAAAGYEQTRERYADEMFPEPPPVHPDDDDSCSEESESDAVSHASSPAHSGPPEAQSPKASSPRDVDIEAHMHHDAKIAGTATVAPSHSSTSRVDGHHSTWPIVSLMANVAMLTAAITAGVVHVLSTRDGGQRFTHSLVHSAISSGAVYAITIVVALSAAFTMLPFANALHRWT